ncbi:imm11 family protein [Gymnodinialimonas ulvae]|uniref:imm11 family protein n=1 Tax=Gymnodinialimonas ulvae TaxID=3126504 RepID=UPI00309AFA64
MVYVIDQAMSGRNSRTGEFVNWDNRVPQLDRRAELSRIFHTGCEQLAPWEVPEHLKISARTGKLPLFFTTGAHGRVIHQSLVKEIEAFDPGQHQFFTLRVTWRNGDEIEGPWFLLNVYRAEASIADAGTAFRAIHGWKTISTEDGTPREVRDPDKIVARYLDYYVGPHKRGKRVVYDPARLSGESHLWREPRFGDAVLCSDALWKAFNPTAPKRIAGFRAKELRH